MKLFFLFQQGYKEDSKRKKTIQLQLLRITGKTISPSLLLYSNSVVPNYSNYRIFILKKLDSIFCFGDF